MSWTQLLSKFFFSDGTFLQDVRFGETATPEHTCPDLHLLTAVQTRQCNRCSWVFNTWFITGFSFSPQLSILMQNNEDFKFKVNSVSEESFDSSWIEKHLFLQSFSPPAPSVASHSNHSFSSRLWRRSDLRALPAAGTLQTLALLAFLVYKTQQS